MAHAGSCLCGAVSFTVTGDLPPPDACHCRQCRKQSGHYFASTDVERSRLAIKGEDRVGWYRSSEKIRRGFCTICGSSLFWDRIFGDQIAIAMGAFDGGTDTQLAFHIFVDEKGDYYNISDGLPQHQH